MYNKPGVGSTTGWSTSVSNASFRQIHLDTMLFYQTIYIKKAKLSTRPEVCLYFLHTRINTDSENQAEIKQTCQAPSSGPACEFTLWAAVKSSCDEDREQPRGSCRGSCVPSRIVLSVSSAALRCLINDSGGCCLAAECTWNESAHTLQGAALAVRGPQRSSPRH